MLLPGPPRELKPMFDDAVRGRARSPARAAREFYKETLFVAGRGESHVEEIAQPIYSRWTQRDAADRDDDPGDAGAGRTAPDAASDGGDGGPNGCAPRAPNCCGGARPRRLQHRRRIDGGGRRVAAARSAGLTIAAAESCTGGLLMSRLTDVAGSSAYVLGGVVAYSNALKTGLADVPAALIGRTAR